MAKLKKPAKPPKPTLESLAKQLADVEARLPGLVHRLTHLETRMAEQTVRLDRLDAATNKIAAELKRLSEVAKNGNMTPEEAERFDQLIANLEALGASPTDPIPELPF